LIPLGARQAAQNFPSFRSAVQILIRNIDRSLSQEQITDLFRKHGKVTSCTLVMDPKTGQSKGFGFAEMPNMDESNKAISQLNGLKVGSSALRVKRAANSTITKHRGRP
jgi:RNA recognition motif-containing protein